MVCVVLAVVCIAFALLPTPLVPRRSHISSPLAISAVIRKPKRSVSDTNRKHALEKRETKQQDERRVARAVAEARDVARAAGRSALSSLVSDDGLINKKRDAVQILRRMGRAGLLPDDKSTALVLDALVTGGTRSLLQHRLVQQVAALCRVYPPDTLLVEQASAFLRSAAALRQCAADSPEPEPPNLISLGLNCDLGLEPVLATRLPLRWPGTAPCSSGGRWSAASSRTATITRCAPC